MFKTRIAWTRFISFTVLLQLLLICTESTVDIRKVNRGRIESGSPVTGKGLGSTAGRDLHSPNSDALQRTVSSQKGRVFNLLNSYLSSEKNLVESFIGLIINGTKSPDDTEVEKGNDGRNSSPDQIRAPGGIRSRRFLGGQRVGEQHPLKQNKFKKGKLVARKIAGRQVHSSIEIDAELFPSNSLGPPAPPLDKHHWNQDYAEPDVHPPSSN